MPETSSWSLLYRPRTRERGQMWVTSTHAGTGLAQQTSL
jgi:hypothetical protein